MNLSSRPPLDPFQQRLLDELRQFVALHAADHDIAQADNRSSASEADVNDQRVLRRRRWTRPVTTVAIACIAAAVVIVLGNGSGTTPSAAAAVLGRLANVAGSQPIIQPGPGQYLHLDATHDEVIGQGSCTVLIPDHIKTWISATDAAVVFDHTESVSFPSAHDRQVCQRAHSLLLRGGVSTVTGERSTNDPNTGETWWAPGCYSGFERDATLQASLDNPKALLAKVRAISGDTVPGPAGEFESVGMLLANSDASPALRAALYRAVATLPGVRLLGTVTDRLGRRGLGLALTSHGWTSTLIIKPRDATLLADSQTTPNGQPNGWDVYHKPTIVNHAPTQAAERLSPPCRTGASEGRPARDGIMIMTGAR